MSNRVSRLRKSDIYNDHFKAWVDNESSMPEHQDDHACEEAMTRFAEAFMVFPPKVLKQTILQKIAALQAAEKNQQLWMAGKFPPITTESNYLEWNAHVQHLSPPEDYIDVFLHELEVTPERTLFVAWVKENIAEEVHHDSIESFIVLEGSCECHIKTKEGNTRVVRLTAGDYLEIPVGESHHVLITSLEPVKAIVQCIRIA